jgi:predicted DNA-binding transcriptional regulator AlpA
MKFTLGDKMKQLSRLITLAEVAELTRIPISTLRYYRQRGEGPPMFRVGRRVMAYEDEVRGWLDAERDKEISTEHHAGRAEGGLA